MQKVCRRCGVEFTDPVPEVTDPGGNVEIACVEYCADCNCFIMNVIHRHDCAYKVRYIHDPVKGR